MAVNVQVAPYHGGNVNVSIEPPDVCPMCHHAVDPRILIGSILENTGKIEIVFRCTQKVCQRFFIARYSFTGGSAQQYTTAVCWRLTESLPKVVKATSFDSQIEKVSPSFVTIYNQSIAAEYAGLDQVCGIGFRKSLEFLVKDYVKSLPANVGKEEEIERTVLGLCIDRYVTDPKVKSTANRATWLGNDETHYVRKWEGKDVSDLKKLIDLTLHWVSSEILTRELESSMPDPKATTKSA